MKEYSFHTAYTQASDLYGLELSSVDFENIGLLAWDKIGNKRYKWYKYVVTPTKAEDGSFYVDLPCNCDEIEAITADYEDYQKTSPVREPTDVQSAWNEDYIEHRKFNTNFFYSSGKYIKYHRVENRIYLADDFNLVKILYKGFIVDDDGLPKLSEKEVDAVATFCTYSDMFKKALMTKDNATMQLAMILKQQWDKKCTQARVPDHINQNEMDEILNVGASWDRKRFGKSFKPIR